MTVVTKAHIVAWLERSANVLEANKGYLTDLDSPIGDADHGTNMSRGFRKVVEKLPTVQESDIGNILKTTGMALMSSVGGASGPLYGTFFMQAGSSAGHRETLTSQELVEMLRAGVDGIVRRGRAVSGDKTMIDAWLPALSAMQAEVDAGQPPLAVLDAGTQAAEQGMHDTIPLQARKGRASYVGERSIGHQDPGATSTHMLLQALRDSVKDAS